MGASWQTPEQKAFIGNHTPSYFQHLESDTLKTFWPDFLKKWFELWPLPESEPAPSPVEGSTKAPKSERSKKVAQLKRVFKNVEEAGTTGGRRDLRLGRAPPRMRSELQVYMSLYYDTRIRSTVLERWAPVSVPNMGFGQSEIPEDEVDPEDSSLFKDTKIPLCFKNQIAQELYDAEEKEIKEAVQSKRDADRDSLIKTVYTTEGSEREELVREYQKNIPSLGRSAMKVLQNAERKCAAKGIVWLACPNPSAGGQPCAQFQCVGLTPRGQDFESFIGAGKAKEIKGLFSNWINTVYPPDDWDLFSLGGSQRPALTATRASETPDDRNMTPSTPGSSDLPDQLTIQPNQSVVPSNQPAVAPTRSPGALNRPRTTRSGLTSNHPDHASDQLDPPLTWDWAAYIQASPISDRLGAMKLQAGDEPLQLDPSAAATSEVPELSLDTPLPNLDTGRPSPPLVTGSQRVTSGQPHLQAGEGSLVPPPGSGSTTQKIASAPSKPLAGVTDEPAWMREKNTLDFFRNTAKLGNLSDVIEHWYELERLLGFKTTTPAGFPGEKRPKVVGVFHKNGHNYLRDYNAEAHTLGHQIMEWWSEICPPGGIPSVRFGGRTGIYTIVVLMSWWCSLLESKPEEEHVDCLRTLKDVDRVLLTAVNDIKGHPTATSSVIPSSTPPSSRPRKRANSGDALPRKRIKSTYQARK